MIVIDDKSYSLEDACIAGIRCYLEKRQDDAFHIFSRIVEVEPTHARALNALAIIACDRGHYDASLAYLDKLLTSHPSFEKGYNTRGTVLLKLGRSDEAEADYLKAISLNSGFVEAHGNLGELCIRQKKWDSALNCFQRISELCPDSARASYGEGVALHGKGFYREAMERFRKALEVASRTELDAAGNASLGSALLFAGAVDEAIERLRKAIASDPTDAAAHSNLLLAMHYTDKYSPAEILLESKRWDAHHAHAPRPARSEAIGSPIRIGYVSSDFCEHVVTRFFEPLLAAHDRSSFRIYCYSDVAVPDAATRRLEGLADCWIDTVGMSDEVLAERISRDAIDILVDLKGHTAQNRLRLFTLKPAPVQATWLGYPGTTGLGTMDYRISDQIADPVGMTDEFHSEKIIRVRDSFLCFKPPADSPPVSSLPALNARGVTFGSFNDLAKITPAVLTTWGKLLKAVPRSRLLLKSKWFVDEKNCQYIIGKLEAEGVDPSRVNLLCFVKSDFDNLECYRDMDIALDTFPYNGTTTTFDSLWMGVPVITLAGGHHAARVGASILSNIGLQDLVADTLDDYIAIAGALAQDLKRLEQLRHTLRERLSNSVLCDSKAFARNMEEAFLEMLGEKPEVQGEICMTRKLHIGGTTPAQGWEILNVLPGPHVDHLGNAGDLSRFPDCTFDDIYASHVVEHFDYRHDLPATLKEWLRVLIPSGKLYISVPDLDTLARLFIDKERLTADERFHVMRMMFGGHVDEHDYHNCGLNEEFLRTYLYNAGFVNIRRVDRFAIFADTSSMVFKGLSISLNLIAEKPMQGASTREEGAAAVVVDGRNMGVEDALNLASWHFQEGRLQKAEDLYLEIKRVCPDHPRLLHALGVVLFHKGSVESGIEHIKKALKIRPDYADAWNNLGNVFREVGKFKEAESSYRKATELQPNMAVACSNLAGVLMEVGRYQEAEMFCRRALEISPNSVDALNCLGNILKAMDRVSEAEESFRKAIALDGNNSNSCLNLGAFLVATGKLSEAEVFYRKALTINPGFTKAYNNLAILLLHQGRADEAVDSFRKALEISPDFPKAHSNLVYAMNYSPNLTAMEILEESLHWDAVHGKPLAGRIRQHNNARDPERRLRIGYVSPDFREHSVSFFFESLLEAHNDDEVLTFCYSDVASPDETTERLQLLSQRWRNCLGLSNEEVARQIRKDRIDILVDLAGHTAGNRLLVFAEKPAPVQVTWLGYPNTTGLSTMDYRITDAIADPVGVADPLHTEKLYRLAEGFLCYSPPIEAPAVSPLPAAKNGFVTFGSFNKLAKITPEVIELWAAILKRVPGSRLFLKNVSLADAAARASFLDAALSCGIDSSRIDLVPYVASKEDHLALYGDVDISLDTFPYNGTTTTCESLWMGVPVVALLGDRHASRVGGSILSRVGLDDLAARNRQDYVDAAVNLARNSGYLAGLRCELRDLMARSPLCDSEGFARSMEAAYREMWRKWCDGE